MWIVSILLSDTWNNNLSLSVIKTGTFSGCKLEHLSNPQGLCCSGLQLCRGCRLKQSARHIPVRFIVFGWTQAQRHKDRCKEKGLFPQKGEWWRQGQAGEQVVTSGCVEWSHQVTGISRQHWKNWRRCRRERLKSACKVEHGVATIQYKYWMELLNLNSKASVEVP